MPEVGNYEHYVHQDLRSAIVGFGKMGILHSGILNMLAPGLVKAAVDKSRLMKIGASRLIKGVNFYNDLDRMLRRETPDVVYVTTPVQFHKGIVDALLRTNVKYVFLEKPPTVTHQQLFSLIEEMRTDQTVMVGLQKRFAFPFRHVKMLLSDGILGEIAKVSAYIRSADIQGPVSRSETIGRGALLDLGIHLVDLLLWIFDVRAVEASISHKMYGTTDDRFEMQLRTTENVEVTADVTWSDNEYRWPETRLEISGTRGVLRATEDYVKVELTEKHLSLGNERRLALYKPHYYQSVPPVNLADPEYTLENLHFLSCIFSQTEPLTSLKSVSSTMNMIDELYAKAIQ
jgi:predicted dehydrogenase